jgi:hypothetical protein
LRNSQPRSFWDEAAARAQPQGVSDGWTPEQQQPVRRSIRREPPPAIPALVPTDDQLRLRLAEELEYARRMLNTMGDQLAGDPAVVTRHTRSLQSVDIVGQILSHIADVVRCSSPEDAVDRIGMAELKGRLQRRSIL